MTLKTQDLLVYTLVAAVLAGCASSASRAPVSDLPSSQKKHGAKPASPSAQFGARPATGEQDWRPRVYVVQKGDTLYAIAFNYGLDYHELASLNNIQNPDVIKVGQELRLFGEGAAISVKPSPPEAMPTPIVTPQVESTPLDAAKPTGITVITQPVAVILPYSADAAAQITRLQEQAPQPAPVVALTQKASPPKSEPKPVTPVAPPAPSSAADVADDAIEWGMPTSGKVIADYSESDNRKGIDLAGNLGQPIVASAAGKVVYSGSGLRGYGKLIIIKHNQTFLSAYAHNDRILVKEGQTVTKGQKIAEMGNSDADQVELHFEIRKLGKPVDPAKYLPLIKS